jgi:hypothetical protein
MTGETGDARVQGEMNLDLEIAALRDQLTREHSLMTSNKWRVLTTTQLSAA